MKPPFRPRSGLQVRVLLPTVAVAAALVLLGAAAEAGIRDRIKSAKDRATGQKAPEPSGKEEQAIEFDDTTLELTGELLDRLIACRKPAQALLKDRPALIKRRDEIPNELNGLEDRYGGEMFENHNQRGTVAECMSMEFAEIRSQRHEAETRRMMANPASGEKLLKMSAAMNDAQLKGDTAAVARLRKQVDELFAPPLPTRSRC